VRLIGFSIPRHQLPHEDEISHPVRRCRGDSIMLAPPICARRRRTAIMSTVAIVIA